jgi:hypothetical protein
VIVDVAGLISTTLCLASSDPAMRKYLVAVLLSCVVFVRAVNHTVGSRDPRITYTGTWLDQDNGGHQMTGAPDAAASFSFTGPHPFVYAPHALTCTRTGSAVYFLSAHNWNGANATVSVDGGASTIIDEAAGTKVNDTVVADAVLFARTGLDGTKEHTIQVAYAGAGSLAGVYLEVYGFTYVPLA